MPDLPIAYTVEGRPLFDNTPTVVIVLAYVDRKLVAIRRGHNPGKGLIGLPGGYHMRGETWQQAGAREMLEETGIVIDPDDLVQVADTVTDEYGNNLIFALCVGSGLEVTHPTDGEAEEVLFLSEVGDPSGWAFPRHYEAAKQELARKFW